MLSRLSICYFLLFTSLIIGCKLNHSADSQLHARREPGEKWLTWSGNQRDVFMAAYIDGYRAGINNACLATDQSLELKVAAASKIGAGNINLPSSVCRAGADSFSLCMADAHDDNLCGAYTQVITDFYTRHPEYRVIPVEYLMQFLVDRQQKDDSELYKMALSGSIRTKW
jgi:hypothetical protein